MSEFFRRFDPYGISNHLGPGSSSFYGKTNNGNRSQNFKIIWWGQKRFFWYVECFSGIKVKRILVSLISLLLWFLSLIFLFIYLIMIWLYSFIYWYIYPFISLSTHPFIYLLIYFSINPFIHFLQPCCRYFYDQQLWHGRTESGPRSSLWNVCCSS